MPKIRGVKDWVVSAYRNLQSGGRPAIALMDMCDRKLRNPRAPDQISDPLRQRQESWVGDVWRARIDNQ